MITNLLRILAARSLKPLKFTDETNYDLRFDIDRFGIYIHIPFCKTLCPFCPYNRIKYDKDEVIPFKKALIKEIEMVGALYKEKKDITSVYFGGGSPALMIDELGEIITRLKRYFNVGGNIGIELHPRDITEENIQRLKELGFDMVSIGIQSFQKDSLDKLERHCIDGSEKVRLAKKAGFKTIDVDLIFGIPGQDEESLKLDFRTAFNCGATQVSTYPFIDFSYANNKSKPLGKKDKKTLLKSLEKVSWETDCERTAVWTFARKDTVRYSSVTRDAFIGFGPSAASLGRDFFKLNTFSVEEYIKCVNKGKIPAALTMKFNLRTRALYWMFWNAYTLKLDDMEFEKLFGVSMDKQFKLEITLAELMGLLRRTKHGYELTDKGTYIYHLIEQNYTHQYIDKTWRIARQNPWPKEISLY